MTHGDQLEPVEQIREFVIPVRQTPERVDAFLTHAIEHATRSKVQKAIDAGSVVVNGKVVKANYRIKPGDVVRVTVRRPPPVALVPQDIPLTVLFEDEHLLVIDKQAGLLTHPGVGNRSGTLVNAVLWHMGVRDALPILPRRRGETWSTDVDDADESPDIIDDAEQDTIVDLLDDTSEDMTADETAGLVDDTATSDSDDDVGTSTVGTSPSDDEEGFLDDEHRLYASDAVRPGIIHRLDRDTTGVIVVGKSYEASMRMTTQFKNRTVDREYVAIVWGVLKDDRGLITGNIGVNTRNRKLMAVVDRGGKEAATEYTVLERYACATLVRLKLRTGRTHQIRVHMSSQRHPVMGDPDYGGKETALSAVHHLFRNDARRALACMERQALHARTLGFTHPMTKERLAFASPVPPDMEAAIAILRQTMAENVEAFPEPTI